MQYRQESLSKSFMHKFNRNAKVRLVLKEKCAAGSTYYACSQQEVDFMGAAHVGRKE